MNLRVLATASTITFAIFVYFLQTQYFHFIYTYGLNINFLKGAYYQLLTTMFIHGGLTHLAMNMIVLFQFGSMIENARGKWFFILLYYAGGILTSILTFLYIFIFSPYSNVVGASGAICVLIGWVAQKDPLNRKGLVIAILLISFAPILIGIKIAWFSHIFGFLIGYVVAKIYR